jgi:prefoldin alpha subunit
MKEMIATATIPTKITSRLPILLQYYTTTAILVRDHTPLIPSIQGKEMAEYQSVSVSNEREVSAEDLSLDQLANLKQQHEDEIKELSSQLDQLFGAKNRYINARNVLDDMNKTEEDSTLLIPLTSSLYAPGKIQNPKKVIVELGTGYFIEKTIPEAKDLISRKVFLLIYFFSPLLSISLCVFSLSVCLVSLCLSACLRFSLRLSLSYFLAVHASPHSIRWL